MTAGIYNFTIEKGATFSRVITWKDASDSIIDLTGYTARMQVRTRQEAASPFLELTTENGGITLGGAAGTITLSLSDTATSSISAPSGVYDLELVSGAGEVTRLIGGSITIAEEVTR